MGMVQIQIGGKCSTGIGALVVAARMGHPKDNLGASNNGWRVEGASLSLSISMRLFLTTLEKINFGHCSETLESLIFNAPLPRVTNRGSQ